MEPIKIKISTEFSSGNFEFSYPHFSEDIQWNVIGNPVLKGKKAVIDFCNKMLLEMVNSTLNNTSHIVGDNSIVVQGYCDYINENNTPGKVEYCDIYHFNEDQLQEITSYCIEMKSA